MQADGLARHHLDRADAAQQDAAEAHFWPIGPERHGVQAVLNGEYKVGLIVLAIVGFWMWRRWQWRLYGDFGYDE